MTPDLPTLNRLGTLEGEAGNRAQPDGSAYYSPATAAIRMAESYLHDKKEILPCAAYLEGEYGYSGFYLGVPVRIGAGGVEQVVELELTEDEARQLEVSASHVKELVDALDRVIAK